MDINTDTALKNIAKGASLAFAGIIISKILGYSYRIIVARLGPADYGQLSIALAIFNFFGIIAILGLTQGIQRYVPYYNARKEYGKARGIVLYSLKLSFITGLLIGILLFLFSDYIAINYFHEEKLSILIKLVAFIIPIDVIRNIFLNLCKSYNYIIPEIYARNFAENFVKVILTLVFLLLGYGLLGATFAYISAITISCIISYYLARKLYNYRKDVKPEYDKKIWLNYSIPLLINHFLLLIMLWTDTFLLGYFKTSTDVGIYNAAAPTAQLIYIFPAALLSLFLPVLSNLYSKNEKKSFNTCYSTVTKWIFIINMLFLLGLVVFSKQIITLLFGAEYYTGYLALIILSVCYFVYHLSLTSNNIMMIYERTKTVFLISLIGAVLNVILNYYLIPTYSYTGAAISTGISVLVMGIINFIVAYKITKYNPINKKYIKILLITILLFIASYYISNIIQYNYLLVALVSLSTFIIYTLLLLAFKVFNDEDIKILRYIEKGFVNKIIKILKKFI
ncbi:MAG: flippase [Nanoarchaeota archaeon]